MIYPQTKQQEKRRADNTEQKRDALDAAAGVMGNDMGETSRSIQPPSVTELTAASTKKPKNPAPHGLRQPIARRPTSGQDDAKRGG